MNKLSKEATKKTKKLFGNTADATKQNAFMHAYWNALMSYKIGKSRAKQFADAHESWSKKDLKKIDSNTGLTIKELTDMDLYNNKVGREIGASFSMKGKFRNYKDLLAKEVLKALRNGKLKWLK